MRFLALLLLIGVFAAPLCADQTDPRLDALFEELRTTQNEQRAGIIQAKIWSIWFKHENPQVQDTMDAGVVALARGLHEEAVRLFTRVIELAPDFAEAWNRRGTAYYLLGRYRDSLADIEQVLALEPRHFGALGGRGLCLRELGRPWQAIEAFEAALAINPHQIMLKLEIIRLRHHHRPQHHRTLRTSDVHLSWFT